MAEEQQTPQRRFSWSYLFSFVLIVIPYSAGVSAGASVGASVDWAGASVAGVVPIVAGASV